MKHPSYKKFSPEEILLRAFKAYQGDPEGSLVAVANQILCAASKTPMLHIKPVSSARLGITVGKNDPFEVELQFNSLSSFRAILARIGIICKIGADKGAGQQIGEGIELVHAVIQEQPGSPLYKVDANLDIKFCGEGEARLHVIMQNENTLQRPFLKVETRKFKE